MLILIAHGSPHPAWRASVEELVESLQADLGEDRVRLAYLQCAPPTLGDVAAEAVRAGARAIRVLPLFLAEAGHVQRDIHPLVEQLRQADPSVEVTILPPLGRQPLFRELLREIASQPAE